MDSDDTASGERIPETHLSRGATTWRDADDAPADSSPPGSASRDRRARMWLADLIEALELVDLRTSSLAAEVESGDEQPPSIGSSHRPLDRELLFDRFEIMEKVGEGGFGVVLKAYDRKLKRVAALKIPHPGRSLSKADLRSFLNDAYAPARLSHENIVKIHDVGDLGPIGCYIVSEFCDGPNLRAWIKERDGQVSARQAARLLEQLADAVQHAHLNGILHRDIKPDNVLLVSREDRCDQRVSESGAEHLFGRARASISDPVPVLVDFGLARIQEDVDEMSRSGRKLGTLAYSPPENVTGRRSQIGPSSDVYGLGATLYELIVGRPPFKGDDEGETFRLVLETDPVSPRFLRPAIPRDLETICLKCLQKEPSRRFASAGELRDELRRFLNGEPILTRPAPAWERTWKLARRRPVAATLLGVAAVGLVAFSAALVWRDELLRRHGEELEREVARANLLARDAEGQRKIAESQNRISERYLHAANLRAASRALDEKKIEAAQEILHEYRPAPDASDPRDFAWHHLWRESNRSLGRFWGHQAVVEEMIQSPDRRAVASRDTSGKVLAWKIEQHGADPGPCIDLSINPSFKTRLVFSHDSNYLVCLEYRKRDKRLLDLRFQCARLSDGKTRECRAGIETDWIDLVSFSERLDAFVVIVHTPSSSKPEDTILVLIKLSSEPFHDSGTRAIVDPGQYPVLSPAGESYAQREAGRLVIRDLDTGKVRIPLDHDPSLLPDTSPGRLRYSRDGRVIGALDRDRRGLLLWEAQSGRLLKKKGFGTPIHEFVLGGDVNLLAVLDESRRVTILEKETDRERGFRLNGITLDTGHDHLALSPDGTRLATVPEIPGRHIVSPTIWNLVRCQKEPFQSPSRPGGTSLFFSADGRSILYRDDRGPTLWHFDVDPEADRLETGDEEVWSLALSPSGGFVAVGTDNRSKDSRTIQIWDRERGAFIGGWIGHAATVSSLVFSPDGRLLGSGSLDSTNPEVTIWDVASRSFKRKLTGHTDKIRSVAFNADGTRIVSASDDRTVRIWDPSSGDQAAILVGHTDKVRRAIFSPDGKSIASASLDETVRVWDVATGSEARILRGGHSLHSVAWSPDGALIAAPDERGDLRLWDAASGQLIRTIHTELEELRCVAFSPDRRNIAAGGIGRIVRIWDTLTGQELLSLRGHEGQINALEFTRDGRMLVSGDHVGVVRIWRADTH